MHSIQNASLSLNVDTENGWFSIKPLDERFPMIEKIRVGCKYTLSRRRYRALDGSWGTEAIHQGTTGMVEHGNIETLMLRNAEDGNGIGFTLTLGIMQEHPLVIWKVGVVNHGRRAVKMQRIDLLKVNGKQDSRVTYPSAQEPANLGFFSNGWQSWSPTGWYSGDSGMNISRLGFLQHPMIYNPGTPLPHRRGVFSSDMFAVIGDRAARTGFLVGFLAQKNHFGSIAADFNTGALEMWANGDDAVLASGAEIETDWAVFTPLQLDHRAPMERYLEAVARENHVRTPQESPLGWCSWYHYYTGVTARDVEENLKTIVDMQEQLPIQIVQIDDGFESCVGDWFTFKQTFPEGVAPLAEKISREGLIPGIWLAPFIVNPNSQLMHQHRDWILSRRLGRPVNAGYGWNVLTTGLDMTVPDALTYVHDVVKTAVSEWGFKFLKLDFYYAAGLKGRYHDRTKTRAQVLRMGMETIREAVGPDVTLLGCGAPLGSMVGIVDLMRIGPDVSGDWHPNFRGIKKLLKKEPSIPCARNSIRNNLTRANLHRQWWINDPDCLLVRPESNLTLAEVRSLATAIGMTGGALMISDDLTALPAERLRIAQVLHPVPHEAARVMDWFDAETPSRLRLDLVNGSGAWYVLAAFNWSDRSADILLSLADYSLEEGEYLCREFWNGRLAGLSNKQPLLFKEIPAHGCLLLAVRKVTGDQAMYLGSDLHFCQGVEVAEWHQEGNLLEMTLRLPRSTSGEVFLRLPCGTGQVRVNGNPAALTLVEQDIYSLPVQVDGFCYIQVQP